MARGGETFRGNCRSLSSQLSRTSQPRSKLTKKCMEATSAFTEHVMRAQTNIFIMFIVDSLDLLNDMITMQSWNDFYFAHYFDQYYIVMC